MRLPLCVALMTAGALAQSRAFDFNTTHLTTTRVGLDIGRPIRVGNEVASFGGYDGIGSNLFFGDGTNAGTRIVHSFPLHAGDNNSPVVHASGGHLFFTVHRFDTGRELWTSDGTAAGTGPLGDLMPGPADGVPYAPPFVEFQGLTWFTAGDPAHGFELWCSDGTPAGTRLAVDIWQGPPGGSPTALVVSAGKLFLLAGDGAFGRELWVSDGTQPGTRMVVDLSQYSDIGNLTALGGGVVFTTTAWNVGNELFFSDGTAAGTGPLLDIAPGIADASPRHLVRFGNEIVFQARSAQSANSYDLWRTDGTTAGTVPFLTQWTIPFWEGALLASGPWLYRWQAAANSGWELWRTDGTAAATNLLLTTAPMGGYFHIGVAALSGGLLVIFDDGVHGREPWWVPDAGAPAMLADVQPGPGSSCAAYSQPTALGSEAWLAMDDGVHGVQLWKYFPATGALQATADFLLPVANGECLPLAAIEQDLLFTGRRDAASAGLWRTDGTAGGTSPLHLLPVGAVPANGPGGAVVYEDGAEIWLRYDDGVHGSELWRTDGTAAGTGLIADLDPGPGPLVMLNEIALDGVLVFGQYFQGQSSAPRPLWRTDGTPQGTYQLHPNLDPRGGCRVGNVGLFGGDGGGGQRLWRTDGTVSGTFPLTPAMPVGAMVGCGDHALLFVRNGLWRTDGTAAGTVPILASTPQPQGLMARVGNQVLYFAHAAGLGVELWRTDGTAAGTFLVRDVNPGPDSGATYNTLLVPTADRVFFAGTTPANGTELWVSDGTAVGTQLVLDIMPGPMSALGNQRFATGRGWLPLADNRRLLFLAEDLQHGQEFWVTDGTAAGTTALQQAAPDSQSAWALSFVRAGASVWWQGRDDAGTELWQLPLATVGMAAVSPFGSGCAATTPSRCHGIDVPRLGNPAFALGLRGAMGGGLGMLVAATVRADLLLDNCRLHPALDGMQILTWTDAAGSAVVPVPVPASTGLLGIELFAQWLTLEPGGPAFGLLALSNALHVVVGG